MHTATQALRIYKVAEGELEKIALLRKLDDKERRMRHARTEGLSWSRTMLTYGVSLWLASKSDTAVAYASCDQNPSNPEKTLEIHQLYVRAAARGHGIARKMLTHILQQARSDGYVKATTMIADHDPIAVALARGIGFHLEHNAEEYVCRISLEELLPSRA